jgi:NADPH:quinone reductase-like Zn-dependent oxidoreductase/acyl carrier protein
MHPLESGGWKFQVHSRPYGVRDAEWSLNADGSVVAGADEAATAPDVTTPVEPMDETVERLNRISPQQLFETFNDMELAWGPTWATSLKSLWVGDGEAIGDVSVGDELAEHLGSEPIHPVLLDLCTGVAFPAFPALLAAQHGVADLFLPLRYGQVELRERMPRRFYCRARWHVGALDAETQVFDLDFLDRDGHRLGGISEFTVKRAPREALLRGLGGDTTRLLYTVGWHETPTPGADSAADNGSGTWLIAGSDALTAELSGAVAVDPSGDRQVWQQAFTDAAERGVPVTGIVWRSATLAGADESTADLTVRLEAEIGSLLGAVHAALAQEKPALAGGLWIITERAVATEPGEPVDPVQAALWGLGRTIIAEQPTLRCRLVDCDSSEESTTWLGGAVGKALTESQLALRQGKFLVPRLLHWARSGQLPMPRSDDYVLAPTERGAIDNLRLTEAEVAPPDAHEVQVRVEAAGLNFRDVLNVLGLYPGDPGPIGGDLCGVITELGSEVNGFGIGQRVMGFMQGAFASRINVPAQLLAPVPDGIDPVGAATIPAAALTARLAFDWAKLQPGDRVLIHAASGGVGLAAIQLARQCGATVFATASAYKRATLREMGVEYVYDSRTTDFADQILADTDGDGVDVVLNSLTNEGFVEATVRATAKGGRFAEIAKRDIWTPEQMAAARPDIDYGIVALDATTLTDPAHIQRLMTEVSEGLAKGEWAPVPAEVYPLTEARAAFRRMQQARHIGKIVVQMPKPLAPRGDRTYLVTGGLGALGLHTAAHLAQLGAGDIVLTSRRAVDADAERAIAAIAERFHCQVHVFSADVGEEAELAELLARIRSQLPPLAGVVHLAGVLDDALLPQQDLERFRTTLRPKALGAYHLHRLTEDDQLDFFILYSSASAVLGSPSQANYATANALLDGLAAHRKAHGLPATAVDFGAWGGGGMASSQAAVANLSAQGMMPLEPTAALAALSEVVRHGTGQATVLKVNWQRAAKMLAGARPPFLDNVLPSSDAAASGDSELLRKLQEVPVAQRVGFITEFLQREVQGFLRLAQPPAATSRFLDLGTDSLMAVELRNRLFGQFGGKFDISPTAVFDYPTIGELAGHLVAQLPESEPSSGDGESAPETEAAPAPAPTD